MTHRRNVFGRGTAAAADDTCTGVARHGGIARHDFGGTVVMYLTVYEFGNATVCHGHENWIVAIGWLAGLHVQDRRDHFGCADTAVGTAGMHAQAVV